MIVALTLARPRILETLTSSLFDAYQQIKPRGDFDSPITIIDIDEESLRRIGQWPWDRDTIATMVRRLGEAGAAAIAFDMVFAEPDRTSPERIFAKLKRRYPTLDIAEPSRLPDNDQILAATFGEFPVVAGFILSPLGQQELPQAKTGFAHAGTDPVTYLPDFGGAVRNLPVLEATAPGMGFVNYRPSHDRVIRAVPLVARAGDNLYPSLALEALRMAQGANTIQIRSTAASGEVQHGDNAGMVAVRVGQLTIPTSADGEIWLHYTTGPEKHVIPAWQLADSNADMATLAPRIEGTIVLIGTSAAGLLDIVATPMAASVPGVFVQAEIIDQVLDGNYLQRPDWAPGAELALVLLIGLMAIWLLPVCGAVTGAAVMLATVALTLAGSWLAFAHYGLLLTPVYAVLSAFLVYLAMTGVLFLITEKERQSIRQAFGLYLAPALVERLAEEPEQLKLGGEDRELTIMFSDIRGFTTISESLPPTELTTLINNFLTPMSDELLKGGATIDKYIGDAIMAFWNAPLPLGDHAAQACRTVLGMVARLDEVRGMIGRPLDIGIGLNTGMCCVGNLGSAQRFNYSAIGDAVNLASRIESLTKQYGTTILAGPRTVAEAPGFAFLEVDQVRVAGKTEPIRLYCLLGDETVRADPQFSRLTQAQNAMLEAFRAGRWQEAGALVDKVEEASPTGFAQQLSRMLALYRQRIAQFILQPPAEWDGVISLDKK
jgi:adenylate cyclase